MKKMLVGYVMLVSVLLTDATAAFAGAGGPVLAGTVVSVDTSKHVFVVAVDTYYPASGKAIHFSPKRKKTVLVDSGTVMTSPLSKMTDLKPGASVSIEIGDDAPGKPVVATAVFGQTSPGPSPPGRFPGFTGLFGKSRADVIARLGTPQAKSSSDGLDHLFYPKLAGSRYVCIDLQGDNVADLYAVYAGKPGVPQFRLLLGVSGAITFSTEPSADHSMVLTYIKSDASKLFPSGYQGDTDGLMVRMTKDHHDMMRFGAHAGDYLVSEPR